MKKSSLFTTAIVLTKAITISSCLDQEERETELPNILFILTDDQRSNTINYLGNKEIVTPNLDKLAREGVAFTNTYIMGSYSGAVSQPSRAMLLTGKYLNNLHNGGKIIPPAHTTIGEVLQENGYNCFGTGKYHSNPESFKYCFNHGDDIFFGGMYDQWNVPLNSYGSINDTLLNQRPVIENFYRSNEITYKRGEYMHGGVHGTDIFTRATIDYINKYDSDKPFFIYTSYMTPHDPRSTHQQYHDMYDTANISIPPNFLAEHPFDIGDTRIRDEMLAGFPRREAEIKQHIRDYYALITHNDDRVGKIIQALEEKGLYDNTVIIFTSDNGLALGQHGLMGKQNVYEHSTKVPLIFAGKDIPANKTNDALVYLSELYPTICEMVGIPKPAPVDGESFYKQIIDPGKPHHDYILTSYKSYQRAIRDKRYKLIKYDVDGKENQQFFDLIEDPYETNDLSGNDSLRSQMNVLEDELVKSLKQYNDTIWKNDNYVEPPMIAH
jgi:arylsulfatase A-like enzyme